MKLLSGAALLALLAAACASATPSRTAAMRAGGDWTRFGYDAARRNAGPGSTGITAENVSDLKRQRVALPGTADSSPIYLRGVTVHGKRHDIFVLTTSYGRTLAIDAGTGARLWLFTPRRYSSWAGSYRITNATPVADPSRKFVYAASPDGRVHKLSLATGREVWSRAITLLPRARSSARRSTSRAASSSRRRAATSATRRPTRDTSPP